MKILVTGATGMIGTALIARLKKEGHDTARLVRSGPAAGTDVLWDPNAGTINLAGLEGFDAVVHLAGESIASGRWTAARKERIRKSRVKGTRLLAESLVKLQHPPKVLVSSSAIGYYGDRGNTVLTEESSPGTGFLSDVCRLWEAATEPASQKGIRVVHVRTGIVLSTRGGALVAMLLPFRLGVGGKIGTGGQYMSWITITDQCRAIVHAIQTEKIRGPINAVSPNAVTNAVFTKALGAALHRPTLFPLPAFAARMMLGEMADALLLASTRVQPARLQSSGFTFNDREIGPALKHVLEARI
jgi:uncharacterized protein (TIGR01777 family)